MNREDIIRIAREAGMFWFDYGSNDGNANMLEKFAALVAAEKDKEIKRLQDLLYTQLGELTALRAEKQMRKQVEELKEQPR